MVFEGAFQNIVDYTVGSQNEAWFFPVWYLPGFEKNDYGTTTDTSSNCFNQCGGDTRIVSEYTEIVYLRGFQFVDPGYPGNTISVPYRKVDLTTGLPIGDEERSGLSRFNDGDPYLLRDVRDGGTDNLPTRGPAEQNELGINRSTTSTNQFSAQAPWYADYDLTIGFQFPSGGGLCAVVVGSSPFRLGRCYTNAPVPVGIGVLPVDKTFTVDFFWPYDSQNPRADRTGHFTVIGYGRNLDANDEVVAGIRRSDTSAVGGYGVIATVLPQS